MCHVRQLETSSFEFTEMFEFGYIEFAVNSRFLSVYASFEKNLILCREDVNHRAREADVRVVVLVVEGGGGGRGGGN